MKTPNRGNQDEQFEHDAGTFQGRGYCGPQGNMDIYKEEEGYYGGISQFYGDLDEEKVDTEAIDKEFEERFDRLITIAKRVLTPNQFDIFNLCYLKYMSQHEAARELGIDRSTVGHACTRILEILKLHEGDVYEK